MMRMTCAAAAYVAAAVRRVLAAAQERPRRPLRRPAGGGAAAAPGNDPRFLGLGRAWIWGGCARRKSYAALHSATVDARARSPAFRSEIVLHDDKGELMVPSSSGVRQGHADPSTTTAQIAEIVITTSPSNERPNQSTTRLREPVLTGDPKAGRRSSTGQGCTPSFRRTRARGASIRAPPAESRLAVGRPRIRPAQRLSRAFRGASRVIKRLTTSTSSIVDAPEHRSRLDRVKVDIADPSKRIVCYCRNIRIPTCIPFRRPQVSFRRLLLPWQCCGRDQTGGRAGSRRGRLADLQRRLLGRRFSALKQITASNVEELISRDVLHPGCPAAAGCWGADHQVDAADGERRALLDPIACMRRRGDR